MWICPGDLRPSLLLSDGRAERGTSLPRLSASDPRKREFQFAQRMFYPLGFLVVQGTAAEANTVKAVDNAAGQMRNAAVLDAFGKFAAGRQCKLVGCLGRLSRQSHARQCRFQASIDFQYGRPSSTSSLAKPAALEHGSHQGTGREECSQDNK
jgi:hypothetical protein